MAMEDQWKQTALIIIGMQKDFIEEECKYSLKGAKAIVPNVIKTVELARQRGIFIIWAVREHDSKGRDVERFRRHRKEHAVVKGSRGAELIDGLENKEGDYKLVKTRFSAFFNTNLHSVLQAVGITRLIVIGIQTPNCIRQTVFDAVALDYHSITVLVDATAAETPEVHNANIFDMIKVKVLAKTVEEWSESDG